MTTPPLNTRNLAKKFILSILSVFIFITAGLYLVRNQLQLMKNPVSHGEAKVGRVMPDFEIHRFGGGTSSLSNLKAKVILVNFWASWCEACVIEMPAFVQLRKAYLSRGFEIVAINVDENPATVLPPLLKQLGIDFPVYLDPENKLAILFDVHAIPLTVILNQERRVLMIESGEKEWNGPKFRSILEKWLTE